MALTRTVAGVAAVMLAPLNGAASGRLGLGRYGGLGLDPGAKVLRCAARDHGGRARPRRRRAGQAEQRRQLAEPGPRASLQHDLLAPVRRPPHELDLPGLDIPLIARGLGADACRICSPVDLAESFQDALRTAAANGCNYVDRHDVQGGVDLGRSLGGTGPEVYLGYRRGHQFQDDDAAPAALAAPAGASNRYERALVGVDGSPVKSLKVAAQVGWAGHDYDAEYAGDAREEGVFTDAVLTWSVTKSDELQFKTGQARTISTTGKNSILSTTHQLSWKHTFNAAWTAALCGRFAEAEYAPFPRDDIDYTALASLTWNATDALACTLAFSQDWGRNHLNQLAGPAEARREFDRAFVSIGVNRRL